MNTIPRPIGPGRPSKSSRASTQSPSGTCRPGPFGSSRGSTESSPAKTGPTSASPTKRSRTQCPASCSSGRYGSSSGSDSSIFSGTGGLSETLRSMPCLTAGAPFSTTPKNAAKSNSSSRRSGNFRGKMGSHANAPSSTRFGTDYSGVIMHNTGLYNKRSSRRDVEDGAVLSRRDVEAPELFHYVTKLCHHMTLKMRAEDNRPSPPGCSPLDALERWICSPAFSPREWAKLSAFLRDSEMLKYAILLKSIGYK